MSQWQHAGMAGVPTGLPAERVAVKAQGLEVEAGADFWQRFSVLEQAALELLLKTYER